MHPNLMLTLLVNERVPGRVDEAKVAVERRDVGHLLGAQSEVHVEVLFDALAVVTVMSGAYTVVIQE